MQKQFDEIHTKILHEILNTSDEKMKEDLKKQLFILLAAFNTILKLFGETPNHKIDDDLLK
jgi:hypothetical protein